VKITSTVRTKGMQGLRPVHLESLINPAVGSFGGSLGSMVVQVRNAAGAPVAGLPVGIAGPGSYTQPTSAEGCAFFAYVPVGAYSFSYAAAGWVNQSGENAISQPATVRSDQTASYQTVYDQAAAVQAIFETRVDGVAQAGKGEALTMVHPNIPGDGSRVFEPPTAPAASVDATGLFPFPSKYGIYAGSCAANVLPAALLASLPAGRYQSEMLLAPGQGYAALLFEPAIDLRVKHNGTDAADANVYASATATGCGGTVVQKTGAAGSGFEGRLLDPGYPHGTWDLCAEMTVAPGIRAHAIVTGVVNDQLEGVDVNIDIPNSAVDSPCVV
jgi:hypothetical protein